ncbi:MAG: DUF4006 family protein [Campylobacter sp.]
MENTNRNVFALNGVTGMLIATVLLLSILGILTYFAINIQHDVAIKPYALDGKELKMRSVDNASHKTVKE